MEEEVKSGSIFKTLLKIVGVLTVIWGAFIAVLLFLKKRYQAREEGNNDREIKEYYAVLGGNSITPEPGVFKGLVAKTILGGTSINLKDAVFEGDSFISLDVFMGGVDIRVPEGVNVKIDGRFKASGTNNSTDEIIGEDVPTLYIAAKLVASGLNVRRCTNGEQDEEKELFAED